MRRDRRLLHAGAAAAILQAGAPRDALAEPYRLRADVFAEAPPASGFVALSGEAREQGELRYDAEALVWTGAQEGAEGDVAPRGEAVLASVRVSHPQRLVDVTFGRQLYMGGAVRPIHFDGARAGIRSDTGGELEVFGGLPVHPRWEGRSYDWLVGYRFTHRVDEVGRFGFSYWQERDQGQRSREELGVEGALTASELFSLTLSLIHISEPTRPY